MASSPATQQMATTVKAAAPAAGATAAGGSPVASTTAAAAGSALFPPAGTKYTGYIRCSAFTMGVVSQGECHGEVLGDGKLSVGFQVQTCSGQVVVQCKPATGEMQAAWRDDDLFPALGVCPQGTTAWECTIAKLESWDDSGGWSPKPHYWPLCFHGAAGGGGKLSRPTYMNKAVGLKCDLQMIPANG